MEFSWFGVMDFDYKIYHSLLDFHKNSSFLDSWETTFGQNYTINMTIQKNETILIKPNFYRVLTT